MNISRESIISLQKADSKTHLQNYLFICVFICLILACCSLLKFPDGFSERDLVYENHGLDHKHICASKPLSRVKVVCMLIGQKDLQQIYSEISGYG